MEPEAPETPETALIPGGRFGGGVGFRVVPPVSEGPYGVTDSTRLNRITSAVVAGVPKSEFPFESDAERHTWDRIVGQVAEIRAAGGEVSIPNETT